MRILAAEDEPVSRSLLENFLQQWGYDVITAMDGNEAWSVLQQDDAPKLAILDWMMPGMDGVRICREVRRRAPDRYTYILLLSAKSQKGDLLEGMNAGADDYVTKPFDPDELRARLRAGRRILDLQDSLLATREAMNAPATHDLLTGLWNREAILGMLRQKVRDRRYIAPVGIILVDLDHFKHVVKVYSPAAGDAVLREVARRVRSVVDIPDTVGRTRAGEVMVVVPQCYHAEVVCKAERLRAAISHEPVDTLGGPISVTASIGVATTEETRNADALLRGADVALRRAKAKGRNLVEVATAEDVLELTAVAG